MQQIFDYYLRLILGFGGPLLSGGPGPCPFCPVGNQSLAKGIWFWFPTRQNLELNPSLDSALIENYLATLLPDLDYICQFLFRLLLPFANVGELYLQRASKQRNYLQV